MVFKFLVMVIIAFVLHTGCADQEQVQVNAENENGQWTYPYSVETLDEEGFRGLVQNRNGRVLLLNVWATWCAPCREEMPDLIELADRYGDEPVDIIGLSADYPDEIESKILPFLNSQKINFKIYVKNVEDDGAFINSVNPKWSGALPVTVIYNENGQQQEFLLGKQDFEKFEAAVDQVLNRSDNAQ